MILASIMATKHLKQINTGYKKKTKIGGAQN